MSHRRIRDRVEKELFTRLRTPKEESEDVAQTKRTRRIVEATKGLLTEDPSLTTDELHRRLSRNGASLPKPASFAPYATQARKELGIDGRKAVAGHTQDPQGEDPAGASEAGAEAEPETPAPPAERPSNEAQVRLERDSAPPAAEEELEEPDRGSPTRRQPGPLVWIHPQVADDRILDSLSAAGYLPVVTDNPDHIRAIEPIPLGGVDVIMRAALGAIRDHKSFGNVKEDFGERLAEGLLAALPGEDGER